MKCMAAVAALVCLASSCCQGFGTRRPPSRPAAATVVRLASTIEPTSTPTTLTLENSSEKEVVAQPIRLPEEENVFHLMAGRAGVCLVQSELRRNAIGQEAGRQAAGATNWVDDASAYALKNAMDLLKLKLPDERTGVDRDEASSWIRWMKAIPAPAAIDFSADLRQIVNETLPQTTLELLEKDRAEFLKRLGCRLILLPSGTALPSPLAEFPGSMIYGKLLYGGVTRSRLLSSSTGRGPTRAAGLRTEVKSTADQSIPTWIMFGAADRMYEAVDMGPAAVLEVVLIHPQGTLDDSLGDNMVFGGLAWPPHKMFGYCGNDESAGDASHGGDDATNGLGYTPSSLSGRERNEAFRSDFVSSVGGLQSQIDAIVRRVLDGRVIRLADSTKEGVEADDTSRGLSLAAMEAEELALLGLTPVKGLLLYGPPGCGKTVLAREISRALKARAPKIVSAPELLDRWVGGSEKLVRSLFADAEAELASHNGDATKSALHVIVIDEIDAVFRKRSSAEDTGEATRASVVNQILSKLDGVSSIPNVLLIGMTNRRELLDEALLRPGRLEVQVEIPLPDREGRREILNIHFEALRRKGRLSMPLCCAIDGVPYDGRQQTTLDDDSTKPKGSVLWRLGQTMRAFPSRRRNYDLAADFSTNGFSGADIAGLVRAAGSLALSRARRDGTGVDGLLITLEDVQQGLTEVKT